MSAARKTQTGENKMSNSNVAEIILKQMGGTGRIQMMTGAKSFVYDFESVQFKFLNRKRSKPNSCKVTYDSGQDFYTVNFDRVDRYNIKALNVFHGIYADQLVNLFETETGLYLSL